MSCLLLLISSFAAHLGDAAQVETEETARQLLKADRLLFLRTGHLLEVLKRSSTAWRRLARWQPVLTQAWRSCFLSRQEVVQAVEELFSKPAWSQQRTVTLLGANRPLRDVLPRTTPTSWQTHSASLLSMLQLGPLLAFAYAILARYRQPLKVWQCHTLEPSCTAELLALYNPLNYQHVALAGYNTGVDHFGWKFPDKTVVKTVASGKLLRVSDDLVKVDTGVTLKRVVAALNQSNRELFVLPNYSYISMGTVFFVPIHGSGSDVSVLGETIEQALLYDPRNDEFVRVKRGQPRFAEAMYNPQSGLLLLRMDLRIRDKSRYFCSQESISLPSAAELWEVFQDSTTSNIEIRKSHAANFSVEISRYYTSSDQPEEVLEVPKDRIGRIWDRLEENPLSSLLFHTFVRKFGYHVELFLDRDEFEVFWKMHQEMPLSKIQLRFVRADDLPHSPIGSRDCVSADLFLKRKDRDKFLAQMKAHLPHAKYNPGKHSM